MIANNATVLFENADVAFLNFRGAEGRYNREGDRNFCIILPEEQAMAMADDGWNIKRLKPREDEEIGKPYLQITVGFKINPPKIIVRGDTSKRMTQHGEETCAVVDDLDIVNFDCMVRARHWEVNGDTGVKAYLKSAYITIEEDFLDLKYAAMDAGEGD